MPRYYRRARGELPSYQELLDARERRNAKARAYAKREDVKKKRNTYAKNYRKAKRENPFYSTTGY